MHRQCSWVSGRDLLPIKSPGKLRGGKDCRNFNASSRNVSASPSLKAPTHLLNPLRFLCGTFSSRALALLRPCRSPLLSCVGGASAESSWNASAYFTLLRDASRMPIEQRASRGSEAWNRTWNIVWVPAVCEVLGSITVADRDVARGQAGSSPSPTRARLRNADLFLTSFGACIWVASWHSGFPSQKGEEKNSRLRTSLRNTQSNGSVSGFTGQLMEVKCGVEQTWAHIWPWLTDTPQVNCCPNLRLREPPALRAALMVEERTCKFLLPLEQRGRRM